MVRQTLVLLTFDSGIAADLHVVVWTSKGASKLALPNLLPSTLWEKSGRWKAQGSEVRC